MCLNLETENDAHEVVTKILLWVYVVTGECCSDIGAIYFFLIFQLPYETYFEDYYSQSTWSDSVMREDVANKMMSFSSFINSKPCVALGSMSQEWLNAMKECI